VATLILTQPQIRALLSMRVCMDLVADVLASLARGDAHNPLRWVVKSEGAKSVLAMMPARMSTPPALGLKAIAVFPENRGTPYESHQGVVLLFDAENGVPRAVLDASEITAIRTAAASGVATRALAREDAKDLAILGSGVQARVHLEAMLAARSITRVRVFSEKRANREAFAERESMRHGIYIEPAETAAAAVEGADVVCTTTSSRTPVLEGRWLSPGAHVNAAGACVKSARELDTEAVRRARLFVDRIESAHGEAGDFLIPKSEGAIGDEHILGELGDVLIGKCEGRRSSEDVTLFKSLGIAVEDLAAACYLDRRAREKGIGTLVELGGTRDDGA
jgi:ornithine cyclodeaminase